MVLYIRLNALTFDANLMLDPLNLFVYSTYARCNAIPQIDEQQQDKTSSYQMESWQRLRLTIGTDHH